MSIEAFIQIIHDYMNWYREKRIKISLGGMSPLQGKVLIILKNGTQVFSIDDKKELIDYWQKKYQEILQMDSFLFQQEIIDTGIACNFIGAFIDFIKRDNRMNEEGLDFDTLLDSLGVEKSFPIIVTKTVFNWIAQYPEAKLFDVLELINDLYNSADICFSEFPNILDDETHYIFRKMQFERDINGINLLLLKVQYSSTLESDSE